VGTVRRDCLDRLLILGGRGEPVEIATVIKRHDLLGGFLYEYEAAD
jgi:hypothetical protein